MNDNIVVPAHIWKEVSDFFAAIVAPCRDCLRGNLHSCWESRCAAFQFRGLARSVASVSPTGVRIRIPRHVLIENEILDALQKFGKPIYPSMLVLTSTNSKANKRNAIDRLVRKGRIVETRINSYTRMISLPDKNKGNPKNENTKPTIDGGSTRRAPARELGAGSTDAGNHPGAV